MPIIELNGVTKEYRLGQVGSMKQTVLNLFARIQRKPVTMRTAFRAIDSVSFSIEEGEVVGIIGTNGAGKSTILKLLAGITSPTMGDVAVRGSVAPLIEVGAGFHPELTGRENIYLNGAIMSIPREVIKTKIDDIIEFSELEEFIDTPVKRYSSGMTVRLGFAVATSVEADILIVDEVLAVGDLAFQRKCFDRMEGLFKDEGRTVLIVGHNIRQIERICSRVILLDHGKVIADGDPGDVCRAYYEKTNAKITTEGDSKGARYIKGQIDSGEVSVEEILLLDGEGNTSARGVAMHKEVHVRMTFSVHETLRSPEVVVGFHTPDLLYVVTASSAVLRDRPDFFPGRRQVDCCLKDVVLRPGTYNIRLGVLDRNRRMVWYGEKLTPFTVTPGDVDMARLPEVSLIDLPFEWRFNCEE